MTPVHICITRDDVDAALLAPLIESNPNAAAVRDSFGWLPLHVLCTRGDIKGDRLAKIIEVLAPANPAAVSDREKQIGGSGGSLEPPGPLS